MSKVVFEYAEYKNFRSVGSVPVRIVLNKHRTTLLSGLNGAGKSSVLSALCFGLFGRGYGSVNKPNLINSINQKQMVVEVQFKIGKKTYKIIRGMKPNVFEIYENGKLINQDPSIKDYQKVLEQQILKFNYRAFTQVVAVSGGSDYTPFMKMTAKDRREFVEDLLDIRVLSMMNNLVKENTKILKETMRDTDHTLKSIKEKITLQESFLKKIKKERSTSIDRTMSNMEELQLKNKVLQQTVGIVMDSLAEYQKKVDEHSELDDNMTDLRMRRKQLNTSISKKKEKQDFFIELIECPTCTQTLNDDQRSHIVSKFTTEIDVLLNDIQNIESEEDKLSSLMETYDNAISHFASLQKEISELNAEMMANNKTIIGYQKQLEEIEEDTSSIDDEQDKLKEFAKDYISSDKKKKEMLTTQQYYELIQGMLSDSGIKSKVIDKYIPTINKLINKYLGELDFFCGFHLDSQFNETIKSRHRDTFTYDSFSEGQKRRIDIAILLTWMEIAKSKNALHTNLVFLDEIDAPIDATGADLMHNLLKTCSADNIFIVSHKGDILGDKVDDVISFRLHNNFTEVVVS